VEVRLRPEEEQIWHILFILKVFLDPEELRLIHKFLILGFKNL
jgi:hypothetical protein